MGHTRLASTQSKRENKDQPSTFEKNEKGDENALDIPQLKATKDHQSMTACDLKE